MSTFEVYAKTQLVQELVTQIISHMRSLHDGMKPEAIKAAVSQVAQTFGDFDFRTNNALGVAFNAVMSAFSDNKGDENDGTDESYADMYKKCRAEAVIANSEMYTLSMQMAVDISLTVNTLSDAIPRATESVIAKVSAAAVSDSAEVDLARFVAADIKPWAMFGIQDPLLSEVFTSRAVAYAQQVANVLQPGAEVYPHYVGNTLARIPTSLPAFDGDEKTLVAEAAALLSQIPGGGSLSEDVRAWIAEALGNSYRYVSVVSGAVLAITDGTYGNVCALSENFSAAAGVLSTLNSSAMKGTEISDALQKRIQQFQEAIYLLHAASIILVGTMQPKDALILGTYPEIPEYSDNSPSVSPDGTSRIQAIYVHPINYRNYSTVDKGSDEWIRIVAHYRYLQQWPMGRYGIPESEVLECNRDNAYQRENILRRVAELNQRSAIEIRIQLQFGLRSALNAWFRQEWMPQKGESDQLVGMHQQAVDVATSRIGQPNISTQRIVNDYMVAIWNNAAVSDVYGRIRDLIARQIDNNPLLSHSGGRGSYPVAEACNPFGGYIGTMTEAVAGHIFAFLKKRIVA